MKKIIYIVGGVILVIVVIIFIINSNNLTNKNIDNASSTGITSSNTNNSSSDDVVDFTKTKAVIKHVYIDISDNSFNPQAATIKAGTTITWVNNDNVIHKIAADYGGASSADLLNGQSYSYVYRIKGIYGYHDDLNKLITGTIIVK